MKVVSLKKLVEDHDINMIEVVLGEGVSPLRIDVGSEDYQAQQNWFVKGDYEIFTENERFLNVLRVFRLEEDLNISVNNPVVSAEASEEEQQKLEEYVNTEVTAVVFNRLTLHSAGREVRRRHVTAFAESVVDSYRKNFSPEVELDDFAVIEIDWANRNVAMKSIALPESDTIEEEQ